MYILVNLLLLLKPIPVTLAVCEPQALVFMAEEEKIEAAIFNIEVKDWEKVCTVLEEANVIEIEKEPLNHEESKDVYVFVDGVLLQKLILERKWGEVLIPHPEYRYAAQMENDEIIQVQNPKNLPPTHQSATIVLGTLLLIFLLLLVIFVKL